MQSYRLGCVIAKKTYSCAVFLHWMRQFVTLGSATGEEAVLTHVEMETLKAPVPNKT